MQPDISHTLPNGEELLLDSSENHYLRPAESLIGRFCHASLTTRRLVLRDAQYDLVGMREKRVDKPIHEVPLDSIEGIKPGPNSDEPFIELDVRNARKELEKVVLWFRDSGWTFGQPHRVEERDEWIDAITKARKKIGLPVPAATRRTGAPGRELRPDSGDQKILSGSYELLRVIGEGGMGLVYEGRDRTLNRPVAIKKMRPDIRLNGRDKAQFLQEARTSAALHHPFIVDIYAILEKEDEIFLVFEYMDGETLQQHVDQRGPMSADALTRALKNICEALSYAHGCKVVHRDLKPSNIMLTSLGYAKVMDFGIARHVKDTASRLTSTAIDTSGTQPYMAPEQELGRSDARSDIFALGVTLYEVLSGQLPFVGPNFFLQKEKREFRPLRQAAPTVPAALHDAVERCLSFDARDRFQTVDEFARAIGL